ncbi:ABC transporter ATP-binding protein [Paenibacillus xylaniclasticus]|uniref:ABC transporter ATP-binding protein n=1 Tax=Paenibacillus xylaniclasticus TaxID=588083 RepID=UPI000FD756B5|nr:MULTISPECIES: ABC transporter ATP-binding protein [Paenibacillus]GFN32287.1 lipid A export ATP-binding/permease protein MsbA [Paenibacillus curdlanolyticus]
MKSALYNIRHTFKMMAWSWRFIRSWQKRYWLCSTLSVLQNAWMTITSAYLIGQTTAHAASGNFAAMLNTIAIVTVIMMIGIMVITSVNYYTSQIYVLGLAQLRKALFAKLTGMPAAAANRHLSGDLTNRMSMDVEHTASFFGPMVTGNRSLFAIPVSILTAIVICIVKQPTIGIMNLIFVLISIYANLACIRREYTWHTKRVGILSTLTQRMIDVISGSITVRMFGLSSHLQEQYRIDSETAYSYSMRGAHYNAMRSSSSSAIQWSAIMVTLVAGSLFVHMGMTDLATVVFIVLLQSQINNDVLLMTNSYHQLQYATIAAARVKEILDHPDEQMRENKALPNLNREHAIDIRCVTVSYDNQLPVLNNMSLQVKSGEKLAIVGSSGGGKTTLIRYLMELAEADQGDVYLFGQPREWYSQKAVRELIAYVPQNCYLFDGTIRDNIAWGHSEATDEMIMHAIREAALEEFIRQLPNGWDMRVGDQGAQLSGGQRQRIAIARAIVKDAPILLLDEATSALDGESEEHVQLALERLMEGRTTIVIAHRLSTIRNADRIIVMENGVIVEEGNHDQLLMHSGRYAQLYQLQFSQHPY